MKKLFNLLSVLSIIALVAVSCSKDEGLIEPVSDVANVTFSVDVPSGVQTRAGEGVTVDELYYEVYDSNFIKKINGKVDKTANSTPSEFTVNLSLVKQQSYTILFWAQKKDNGVYDPTDLQNIKFDYSNVSANDEKLDAFFKAEPFTADGTLNHEVKLNRPFAQLNLATTKASTANAAALGISVVESQVTIKELPTSFDVATGKTSGAQYDVKFKYNAMPTSEKELSTDADGNGTDEVYDYLSFNYLLMDKTTDNTVVDVVANLKLSDGKEIKHNLSSIPFKRNYRTNIIGNLLTTETSFKVVVDDKFADEHKNVQYISDGLLLNENGEYEISSAAGLAYASDKLFANGGKFILTEDIDMTGANSFVKSYELSYTSVNVTKPISIDGNDHVIKNLPGMLLAYAWTAKNIEIKNLTLETPNIEYDVEDVTETKGVGAFIGYAEATSSIVLENCHIIAGKIKGGHWTGGFIGFAAGYEHNDPAQEVFETIKFENCSVVGSEITAKGSVGGIIGHATGSKATLVAINNISVNNNKLSSTGDNNNKAGSIVGTVGSGTVTIDNYVVSRNEVKSNGVVNNKLWGRNGSGGTLKVNGEEITNFDEYTAPEATFTYENGVYTISKMTESALTDILADASTNSYGAITISLADNQTMAWNSGSAGDGANALSHTNTVKIQGGTFVVVGQGGVKPENKLEFENVTIIDNTSYLSERGETAWEFCYLEFEGDVQFTNCIFENTVLVEGSNAVFTNCTFKGNSTNPANKANEYSLWISNGDVTLNGCSVTGYRGVKVHEAYGSDVSSVKIDNCTFKQISEKPGIAIGTVNKNSGIEISNSSFIDCQPGDQGNYIYETDTETPVISNTSVILNGKTLYTIMEAKVLGLSSAEGMFWFAKSVNEGKKTYAGETVKILSDINLANADWTPVGQTGATTFNGVFDGQNYTISNLSVDSETETGANYSSGLFGWIESHSTGHGHVKNVKINGANIKGHHNCGALVGYITDARALVENCHVSNATITCTKANEHANGDKAGALIGNATVETPIKNCSATNSTVSAGRDAGQVVGAALEVNVTGCSATNVTVTSNGTSTGANIRNEVIGRLLTK